jgi:hypothetical protein
MTRMTHHHHHHHHEMERTMRPKDLLRGTKGGRQVELISNRRPNLRLRVFPKHRETRRRKGKRKGKEKRLG